MLGNRLTGQDITYVRRCTQLYDYEMMCRTLLKIFSFFLCVQEEEEEEGDWSLEWKAAVVLFGIG